MLGRCHAAGDQKSLSHAALDASLLLTNTGSYLLSEALVVKAGAEAGWGVTRAELMTQGGWYVGISNRLVFSKISGNLKQMRLIVQTTSKHQQNLSFSEHCYIVTFLRNLLPTVTYPEKIIASTNNRLKLDNFDPRVLNKKLRLVRN